MKQKIQSKLLTSLREGLSAIRLSDYLNKIFTSRGENVEDNGCIMLLKTGAQCTVSGMGKIFEQFKESGKIEQYGGPSHQPVTFYDDDFEHAAYRILNFDQTFYKMPYDCRSSMSCKLFTFFYNILTATFTERKSL